VVQVAPEQVDPEQVDRRRVDPEQVDRRRVAAVAPAVAEAVRRVRLA
jgi:hypothetical protein